MFVVGWPAFQPTFFPATLLFARTFVCTLSPFLVFGVWCVHGSAYAWLSTVRPIPLQQHSSSSSSSSHDTQTAHTKQIIHIILHTGKSKLTTPPSPSLSHTHTQVVVVVIYRRATKSANQPTNQPPNKERRLLRDEPPPHHISVSVSVSLPTLSAAAVAVTTSRTTSPSPPPPPPPPGPLLQA